ncbi:MAG: LPS translocon maturation chaperone LptM [Steroidobacteraceae bacterium]
MAIVTGLIAAALLSGCGQTGPLYLPDAGVTTPVEVRTPAQAESPPPAEPDEEAEEKDRHGDPPQAH